MIKYSFFLGMGWGSVLTALLPKHLFMFRPERRYSFAAQSARTFEGEGLKDLMRGQLEIHPSMFLFLWGLSNPKPHEARPFFSLVVPVMFAVWPQLPSLQGFCIAFWDYAHWEMTPSRHIFPGKSCYFGPLWAISQACNPRV